jgi:hypothetical protein
MGTTPTYAFPYPEGSDDADMAGALEDLADAVDTELLNRATRTSVQRFTTAGGHTYTPSANIKGVYVEIMGGGGAGGGPPSTSSTQASAGAGGKGGAYAAFYLPRSAWSTTVAVTVGAAGSASAGSAGGAGGNTSFGGFGTAPGGAGGAAGMSAGTSVTQSSGGSTAQAFSGTATDVTFVEGGMGGNGYRLSGSVAWPGTGGGSALAGRKRVSNANNGSIFAGNSPGGGGTGACHIGTNGSASAGGAGALGICIVTEIF